MTRGWVVSIAAASALGAACTNDFDAFTFADVPASASATGAGGAGSTTTTTVTTTSSSTTATTTGAGGGTGGEGGAGGQGGGTSVTTGSAGGGATTTTGGGGEDCLDGVDDDGDGLTDCADPDCQPGHECVPTAPAGWAGYFRVRAAPYPDPMPPACPDATAPASWFHQPSSSTCSACACGAWTGAACDPAPLSCWIDTSSCTGGTQTDHTASVASGSCFDVPDIGGSNPKSCAITGAAVLSSAGACPPSGGALLEPEPWAIQADLCGAPAGGGAGCAGGEVCVAKGAGEYDGGACIRKPGVDACPAAWPTALLVYSEAVDDRACSACGCQVTGASCSASTYEIFDFDGCGGPSTVLGAMGCVNVTGLLDASSGSIEATLPVPGGGTCTPQGGQATGSVQPSGAMTVCCP